MKRNINRFIAGCGYQKNVQFHNLRVTSVPEILICTFELCLWRLLSHEWCFRNWQPVHPFCEQWSHSNCKSTSSRTQPAFEAVSLRHATQDLFAVWLKYMSFFNPCNSGPGKRIGFKLFTLSSQFRVVLILAVGSGRTWIWRSFSYPAPITFETIALCYPYHPCQWYICLHLA